MIEREKDGIHWLEFELLAQHKGLTHGVFLRHGGKSQGVFSSLNVGLSSGDAPEAVKHNRQAILKSLNLPFLTSCRCEHGSHVVEASLAQPDVWPLADGITTNAKNSALMIHHADCQAAIFFDPIKKAIANIHSGWRSSVANIYKEAVTKMQERYGSLPCNILAAISPSLGPQNAQFIHYRTELPEHFWKYQIRPDYFDFWAISKDQLMESGLLSDHIQIAGIDTYSTPDDFFSYRRDGPTGRNATIVSLTE